MCLKFRIKIHSIFAWIAKALTWSLIVISISGLVWFCLLIIIHPTCSSWPRFLFVPWRILQIMGTTLSLWVVCYNLTRYIDIETVKLLGKLREQLNTEGKKKIHFYLLDGSDDKTAIIPELEKDPRYVPVRPIPLQPEEKIYHVNVELFDYLGVIELGAIMLELGVISKDAFDNQFGYRLRNIMNNPQIIKHIEKNSEYYTKLIALIKLYQDEYCISSS